MNGTVPKHHFLIQAFLGDGSIALSCLRLRHPGFCVADAGLLEMTGTFFIDFPQDIHNLTEVIPVFEQKNLANIRRHL